MEGSKKAWLSKSFWGSILMVGSIASTYFKYDLGDTTEWVNAITGLLGSGLALYGRVKAVKKLEI